jgi:hypothetical protein
MFAIVTATVTPLNVSGTTFAAVATVTVAGDAGVYTHVEQLNPPNTVTAAFDAPNVSAVG